MAGSVQKYWLPYFKGKILGEITRQDIEDFIVYIESLEEKAKEEQEKIDKAIKGNSQKNYILTKRERQPSKQGM
jgi:hypothetical protein